MTGDEFWMRRALRLAERGAARVSPNPRVGCVIVRGGKKIAEGYHARFGGPHAEVQALRRAGGRIRGATLYVNLEPCSHWGKTPPCTEALRRSGLRAVVCAMKDPNPRVAGRGIAVLRRAGMRVRVGVCEAEARELNRSFIKFMTKRKPYVFLKSALSLDGKIAARTGDSRWISSPPARTFAHRLRSQVDAVLVGARTVRRDDPALTSHGAGRDPVRVVVTRSGRLPRRARIFDGKSPTWVFFGGARPPERAGAEWIALPSRGGRIDFSRLMACLAQRGVSRLLIEGGGETAASALESREADEVIFLLSPLLIGGRGSPSPVEGEGVARIAQAPRLRNWTARRLGNDFLIRGRLTYP